MNETEYKGSVVEAVMVLLFVFVVLGFFLYKFGTNQNTVENQDISANNSGQNNIFQDQDSEASLYNKYVKQIYDAQASGTSDISPIIDNYHSELISKTAIPDQNFSLLNLSGTITRQAYAIQFENLFGELKQHDGGSESKIIQAQITDNNTLLPLSDYDKEALGRIADSYETFAKKLQNLQTPIIYQKGVSAVGRNSLNIAYILRQMQNENDQKIYTLWISKYMENMSAIITLRYAISQKN